MLPLCSMVLMVEICRGSQIDYYREYERLCGLDPSCFTVWTIEEEIESGVVDTLVESDIFETLKSCFEDDKREHFDLYIKRLEAFSVIKKKKKDKNGKEYEEVILNTSVLGQHTSEIRQLQEHGKSYWHEVRMILLRKKILKAYRKVYKSGDVRIGKRIPKLGAKYFGTREEASEFATYKALVLSLIHI